MSGRMLRKTIVEQIRLVLLFLGLIASGLVTIHPSAAAQDASTRVNRTPVTTPVNSAPIRHVARQSSGQPNQSQPQQPQFQHGQGQGQSGPAQSVPHSMPPAVPTNQTSFGIPIEIHQHPERISEFQLLVSNDQGANWGLYQRRQPNDTEFLFEATQDGEYWFSMRTIDRNQQARPSGPPRPELVVAIDTQKPQLRLDAVITQTGSIVSRWNAIDPTLRPQTFKLQYRATGGLLRRAGDWLDVRAVPGELTRAGELEGDIDWWPEIDAPSLELRAEIRDAADNVTVVTRRIDIPKVARQLRPDTPRTAFLPKDPIQEHRQLTGDSAGLNWPSQTTNERGNGNPAGNGTQSQGSPNRIADSTMSSGNPASDANRALQGSVQTVMASTSPAQEERQPGQGARPQEQRSTPSGFSPPNLVQSPTAPQTAPLQSPYQMASQPMRDESANDLSPSGDRQYNQGATGTVDTPTPPLNSIQRDGGSSFQNELRQPTTDANRGVEEILPGTLPSPVQTSPIQQVTLPPGEHALLTNRRQFRLTYEIDAVRPEAVDEVELWMTKDGGNRWEMWATDPDRQSPFPVDIPDEGIYGFRIVVTSTEGFSGRAPQAGDLADIWVDVDLTRPQAVIKAAPLGQGPQAGKLIIQWQATDRKLATRPVSLYYAETLEGPWSVIAAGLENTGTYPWRVDSQIPKQIFLRMEVKDRAGNLAVHDFATPVDLHRLNPTGRIRGFDDSPGGVRSAAKIAPFRKLR